MVEQVHATAASIALAGAFIAGAICISGRWEIVSRNRGDGFALVQRLDRWTGEVEECNAGRAKVYIARALSAGVRYRCTPVTEAEAAGFIVPNKIGPSVNSVTNDVDRFLGPDPKSPSKQP
jgi:hypothetical protein